MVSWKKRVAIGAQLIERGDELGSPGIGRQAAGQANRRALMYLGRTEDALRSVPLPPSGLSVTVQTQYPAQRALYLAHDGQVDEAKSIIDQFRPISDLASPDDQNSAADLRYLLEAAVVLADKEMVAALTPRFASLTELIHTEANMAFCIGRLVGSAYVLLGDPEKARPPTHRASRPARRSSSDRSSRSAD